MAAKVKAQDAEIQRLRDENNRLKGEQGKPTILPNIEPKLISSEKKRAHKTKRLQRKGSKLHKIVVNRQEVVRGCTLVCVNGKAAKMLD